MKKKSCNLCGKPFIVGQRNGAAKYCSDKCRAAAWNMMRKQYHKLHYKPVPPRDIVCKKCGKVFSGKFNAAYCMDCLTDGSKYMTQLFCNRSAGAQL